MFGLSPVRLLIVAVVGLILVGPDKLPQYARQAGAAWKTLRDVQRRVEDELREHVPDLPRSEDLARYVRSPVSLLNQLADRAEAESRGETVPPPVTRGTPYRPPNEPEAAPRDPTAPPVAWGDPNLN